ncbi:hypothetical protein QFZ34_001283 [Phyllobacterium ifriqiyense]|uniref:Uncharacterized protein n=1 Tax=Phyllobacterium ifriqiyense TaxID=314238 RepID=A0ABU0S5S2_9HYPH|nr:hypothetical protein [Phyllobacterium ifriqiyense]
MKLKRRPDLGWKGLISLDRLQRHGSKLFEPLNGTLFDTVQRVCSHSDISVTGIIRDANQPMFHGVSFANSQFFTLKLQSFGALENQQLSNILRVTSSSF